MQKSKSSELIRKISLSAMFLAFAIVSKMILSFNVPIFGAGGMRVGLAGVFTFFPAILFGPVYGGITSALSDLISYLLKPDGPFIPWLTITAFLGGFLKGLIWIIITRKNVSRTKIRAVTAVILVILGGFGITSHISLISDGVTNGIITLQKTLPSKGAIMQLELSPISKIAVDLVKYNNDTITLTKVADNGSYYVNVPYAADIDGYQRNVTKIGAKAFSENSADTYIIPSSITSIDDTAFEGHDLSSVNICAPNGSAAQKYAIKNGMIYQECSDENIEKITLNISFDDMSDDIFTIKSSDTFRKYLSGYINFLTVGLECVMLLGLILIGTDILLEQKRKNKLKEPAANIPERSFFLKIFLSIFLSGLTVTTINTEILKFFLAAWNGREFMILWIPRAVEEMLVCMFQAYIISILYGVYISKIKNKTEN